ncbi:MAG: VWA domain-containing protein [Spirochaetales bacterium]|nr:VWA domain-containing protein [Spirochaetales bacterium]
MFNLETRRRVKTNPPPPLLTDEYNPAASQKFEEMSDFIVYSKGPETIVEDILEVLDDIGDKNNLDLVFAIDATGSMKNDIETLKKDLLPALLKEFENASEVRVGLLFYRDYGDNFNYRNLPVRFYAFTENLNSFNKNLNALKIIGKEGGDIPEAVYEALIRLNDFEFISDNRVAFLIADAPPHRKSRNGVTIHDAANAVSKNGIKLNALCVPYN